jgi:hypothetical protein
MILPCVLRLTYESVPLYCDTRAIAHANLARSFVTTHVDFVRGNSKSLKAGVAVRPQ